MAGALAQHAAYVAAHLERDLDNNHLIANARALAWVGLMLPDLPHAARWRRLGTSVLWEALRDQVRDDGGHVENSTSYHVAVWLDALETALLCQARAVTVPDRVWDTVGRMADFAASLRRPDGALPLLNDSVKDEPLPLASVLGLARGTAADGPPAPGLQAFADSGYVVWRSGPTAQDTYLVFDAGDMGPRHCPGHGHADALSLELWSHGESLLVDAGTYQYAPGTMRDYFRGTAAHSTAMVDDVDQATFCGPFRVAHLPHVRLLTASADGDGALLVGEHDGYRRLASPVLHRRHVRIEPAGQDITVEDAFLGNGSHNLVVSWHLAPGSLRVQGPSLARATFPGGTRLLVTVRAPVEGRMGVQEGWVSRHWYQKETSPVLCFTCQAHLPVTIRTHLEII